MTRKKSGPESELTRRDLLRQLGAAGAAALLGLPLLEESVAAAAAPRVVVVRGTDPLRMVRAAVRAFPELATRVRGKRVVIKPNMAFKNPAAWGNTTSPAVAVAVAQVCKDFGAGAIAAVDHTLNHGMAAINACGVGPALRKLDGVQVISADKRGEYVDKVIGRGKQLKRTAIPKIVDTADVLINVPVAKQHNATHVAFGLKNLMGLIWDRRYLHEMISLHQGIADLSTLIKPQLVVVDATRVMVNNGPQGPGEVQTLNTIVVSTDPLAADAVALGLTQWKGQRLTPNDVAHLKAAAQLGVGVADLSRIRVVKKRV